MLITGHSWSQIEAITALPICKEHLQGCHSQRPKSHGMFGIPLEDKLTSFINDSFSLPCSQRKSPAMNSFRTVSSRGVAISVTELEEGTSPDFCLTVP